jgi:hypothetical protein
VNGKHEGDHPGHLTKALYNTSPDHFSRKILRALENTFRSPDYGDSKK